MEASLAAKKKAAFPTGADTSLKSSPDDLPASMQQTPPEPAPVTGLAAKRLLKRVQEEIYPKLVSQMQSAFSKQVQFDVDWNSFTEGPRSAFALKVFLTCATQRGSISLWMLSAFDGALTMGAVARALLEMCTEHDVKEVLADQVTKVVLVNKWVQLLHCCV